METGSETQDGTSQFPIDLIDEELEECKRESLYDEFERQELEAKQKEQDLVQKFPGLDLCTPSAVRREVEYKYTDQPEFKTNYRKKFSFLREKQDNPDLNTIIANISKMKTDMLTMKADIALLKGDINQLKAGVTNATNLGKSLWAWMCSCQEYGTIAGKPYWDQNAKKWIRKPM